MLMGMLPKIAALVQEGVGHYGSLKASGLDVTPEIVTLYLCSQVEGWNPTVQGIEVLDHDTKEAGCRFLAGIACALGPRMSA